MQKNNPALNIGLNVGAVRSADSVAIFHWQYVW